MAKGQGGSGNNANSETADTQSGHPNAGRGPGHTGTGGLPAVRAPDCVRGEGTVDRMQAAARPTSDTSWAKYQPLGMASPKEPRGQRRELQGSGL